MAVGFFEPLMARMPMAVAGMSWMEAVFVARKVHIALLAVPAQAHDIYSGLHGKGGQLCCGGTDCAATIYRERGGSFEVEIEGRGLLVSVSRVLDPALFVIISYRASRVAETLRGYSLGFSAIPILSAAIGVMISRYRARKIERALAQLAIRAVRISGGQYDELVEFGEGFVEFQRVGEKFNGLSRNAEMPCSSSGRSQPTMTRPGW